MGLYVGFSPEDVGLPLELEDEEYGIIVPIDYSDAAEAFRKTFLSVSRAIVPVDTGFLRSTLECEVDADFIEAQTICEYAEYVEYGTSRQRPQPYFEPALIRAFEDFCVEAEIALQEAEAELEEEIELAQEEEEEEESAWRAFSGQSQGGGGLNFSSFGSFLGSLLATLLVAIIIVSIEAIFGADFSRNGRGGSGISYGEGFSLTMPEIEII